MNDELSLANSLLIFAAPNSSLIHLIILLVVGGVWLINKILSGRERPPDEPRRPRPLPRQLISGVNPMETHDVDQFLVEDVGRGAQPGPMIARQPESPPVDVVMLRPSAARPPQPPRPGSRPAVRQRAARSGRARAAGEPQHGPPPITTPMKNILHETKQAMDRAAASTGEAASLNVTPQELTTAQRLAARDLGSLLKSPADLRRAVVLREVLGPPLALRRRQR